MRLEMAITRCRAAFGAALLLAGAAPAGAQGEVRLNEKCVVSVLNRTVEVKPDGSWVLPNVPANIGRVRARATCVENGITRAGQSAFFVIPANGIVDVPEIVFDVVAPIPSRMALTAPDATLRSQGATVQLQLTATYPAGNTVDVTASSTGTNYSTSNPAIASVSAEGLVTAAGPGTVLITAVNDGATALLRLSVILSGDTDGDGISDDVELANGMNPNDPVDALEDFDRDGLTNREELLLGTQIRNADTDGDTLPDGREMALNTDPLVFDTDGDGLSDGLEVATGSDPRNPLSYNLGQALQFIQVQPPSVLLVVNTVIGEASRQLRVTGQLIDGRTIDLTSTARGTNYASSDLQIVNFGGDDGRIFAGSNGTATVTVNNSGFQAQCLVTVRTVSPSAVSSLAITGATEVEVEGRVAYVAAGLNLVVVDASNPQAPAIAMTLPQGTSIYRTRVADGRLYVAAGVGGLKIYSLAQPLAPTLLGTFDTPHNAEDVAVRGTTAYVADSTRVLVLDVTNPAAPVLIGSLDVTAAVIDVAETYLTVASPGRLRIIDVSNPTAPVQTGELAMPQALGVVAEGRLAYVAAYTNSLRIVSFANPAQPVVIGSTTMNLGGVLQDVAKHGRFAFGADIFFVNGVPITDVGDPAAPRVVARLDFPGDASGTGVDADSSHVYLIAGSVLFIGKYVEINDDAGVAPTVSITSPAPNSVVYGGNTVTVQIEALDDVAVAEVRLFADGLPVNTDVSAPFAVAYEVPANATSVTFHATALDYGNNSAQSLPVTVRVEPDPIPAVALLAPADGSTFMETTRISLQASASDNGAIREVQFLVDGAVVSVDKLSPYRVQYFIPRGRTQFNVTARAVDMFGQTADDTHTVFVIANPRPLTPDVSRLAALLPVGGVSQVIGAAGAVEAGNNVELKNTRTGQILVVGADGNGAFTTSIPAQAGDFIAVVAIDAEADRSASVSVRVRSYASAGDSPMPTEGLELWLRADTGVTRDATGRVSQWTDQSGRNNHAAPGVAAEQPLWMADGVNGSPMVRFDGQNDVVRFTTALESVRTVFWVVQESSEATPGMRALLGHASTRHFEGGNGAPGPLYRGDCCVATEVRNGLTRIDGVPVDGTVALRPRNMAVISLVTTGPVAAGNFGRGFANDFWWGDLAELVIYDRPLTLAERRIVEEHLLVKYRLNTAVSAPTIAPHGGLFTGTVTVNAASAIPGAELYYTTDGSEPTETSSRIDGALTFDATTTLKVKAFHPELAESDTATAGFTSTADTNPATAPGLQLWLRADAGISSHYGYSEHWADQSGQNNDASQATGAAVPRLVPNGSNGLPTVRFDGNDVMRFATRLTTIRTVFWVVKEDAAATSGFRALLGDDSTRDFEGGNGAPGPIWRPDCCVHTGIVNGQTWLNGLPVDGRTTTRPRTMSVIALETTAPVTAVQFGKAFANDNWWGDLAELIIYDRPLSPVERKYVEGYLLAKYESTGTVTPPTLVPNGGVFTGAVTVTASTMTPNASLFYTTDGSEPTQVSTPYTGPITVTATGTLKVKAFRADLAPSATASAGFTSSTDLSPASAPGMLLWLRADAGLPSQFGDFWADQSGNGNHATQGHSPLMPRVISNAANGLPVVRFDGGDVVQFTNRLTTIRTVFWVVKEDAAATSGFRALLGDTQTRDFEGGNGAPGPIWRPDCCVHTAIINGQTWLNGVPVEGRSTPRPRTMSVITLETTAPVSASNFGKGFANDYWWGDLAELIIYDRALTPAERRTVEDYLLAKYETAGAVTAPTLTPNGGVFTGSVTVTASTMTPDAELFYTTDGSEPTQGSTLYSGPITLASTTTLKVKAFRADLDPSATTSAGFTDSTEFSPAVPPGIRLWLRADAGLPGPHADFWADQSGNANHATQPQSGAIPRIVSNFANGLPVVRFDGNDVVRFTSRLTSIRTVFWVVREDEAATIAQRGLLGDSSVRDFEGGNGAPGPLWRPDCCVHTAIVNGQTWLNGLPVDGRTTARPRTLSVISLVTTGPVAAGNFGKGFADEFWRGDLAELIIYDRPLNAVERQNVEDYLRLKYRIATPPPAAPTLSPNGGTFSGSTTVTFGTITPGASIVYTTDGTEPTAASTLYSGPITIGTTTTFKAKALRADLPASATTTVTFFAAPDSTPSNVPNLVLWWRADAGLPTGSTHASEWTDQSTAGNHGLSSGPAAQPSLVRDALSGLPALHFDGATDIMRLDQRITTIRTVFWVVKEDTAATFAQRSLLGSDDSRDFEGGLGAPGFIWRPDCCVSSFITSGQTFLNGLPINGRTTPRPRNFAILSLVTTGNVSARLFGAGGLINAAWWGDLAELIVYDRALSETERRAVEDYLNARYKLFVR